MKVRGDARRLIMGYQLQISVSGTVFRTKRQIFLPVQVSLSVERKEYCVDDILISQQLALILCSFFGSKV